MKKVIIITGPTAIGKTKLSIQVAKHFNTPVIIGDAYQMYQGLSIITAKPTHQEMENVPHLMLDKLDSHQKYSIYNYQQDIRKLIETIDLPLIVGGAGLYIDSVIYNYQFEANNYHFDDTNYSNQELYDLMIELDPEMKDLIPVQNRRRIVRQIELIKMQAKEERSKKDELVYDALIISLNLERTALYERINQRVLTMIENGAIDEVKNHPDLKDTELGKAIGYLDILNYLEGEETYDEMIDNIQKKSRHYAKRQITWYKNHQNVIYLDVDLNDFNKTINEAISLIEKFLKN